MTREALRNLVETNEAADKVMATIQRLEEAGYQPRVSVNRHGDLVIQVTAVLSEWEGEREEEEAT